MENVCVYIFFWNLKVTSLNKMSFPVFIFFLSLPRLVLVLSFSNLYTYDEIIVFKTNNFAFSLISFYHGSATKLDKVS